MTANPQVYFCQWNLVNFYIWFLIIIPLVVIDWSPLYKATITLLTVHICSTRGDKAWVCRLFGAGPLPKPVLTNLSAKKHLSEWVHFHPGKRIQNCRLRNGGHFVYASMSQVWPQKRSPVQHIYVSHQIMFWSFGPNKVTHIVSKYQILIYSCDLGHRIR